jgi:hypothetical protein
VRPEPVFAPVVAAHARQRDGRLASLATTRRPSGRQLSKNHSTAPGVKTIACRRLPPGWLASRPAGSCYSTLRAASAVPDRDQGEVPGNGRGASGPPSPRPGAPQDRTGNMPPPLSRKAVTVATAARFELPQRLITKAIHWVAGCEGVAC